MQNFLDQICSAIKKLELKLKTSKDLGYFISVGIRYGVMVVTTSLSLQ